MNTCINCNSYTTSVEENKDGDVVCYECTLSLCVECLTDVAEIENRDGEHICHGCHSSAIDNAYERMKDEY